MPFTSETIEPFKGDFEAASQINEAVERVRQVCEPNVKINVRFRSPDLASQVAILRQTVAHRAIDTVGGAISAWERGDILESVILARAFIETAALCNWYLTALDKALGSKNADAIFDLNLQITFGARQDTSKMEGVKDAINVLNGIDLFKKRGVNVRWVYENLSEYAHPNGRGLLEFYGDIDHDKDVIAFDRCGDNRRRFAHSIVAATCLVLWLERNLGDLNNRISAVHAFEDEIGGFRPPKLGEA